VRHTNLLLNKPFTMSAAEEVHQRFWGVTIAPGATYTASLERTELHVTAAAVTSGTGNSSILASSNKIKEVTLCTLSTKGPWQTLLDVNFFPADESASFRNDGGVAVSLSGTIAIFGGQLEEVSSDEEEDEEEEDEEEEAAAASAGGKRTGAARGGAKGAARGEMDDDDDEEEKPKSSRGKNASDAGARSGAGAAAASASAGAASKEQPLSAVERMKRKREEERTGAGPEGKKGAEAPSSSSSSSAATPKQAQSSSPAADTPSSPGLLTLAGGKIRYVETAVGSGPKPRQGQKVVVSYVGRLKNGKVFDKSDSFSFRIGTGSVIRGWDEGLMGVAVGGARKLIIHPSMGYGAAGAPPQIPPNSTLIFDVKLLKVHG
jgi:FK506-binding nuclear protein